MPVIVIHGEPLEVPTLKKAGDTLNADESELLNQLFLTRFMGRLRRWCDKNLSASYEEVLAQSAIVLKTFTFEGDAVGLEGVAYDMARELIERHLNNRNVPIPQDLDPHIRALLQSRPEIYDLASQRMTVMQKVGMEMLSSAESAS